MTHSRPLVSIIIPNYNIEKRFWILKEAVLSVLLQSYRPLEIIIVNDPGNDNTYDLVLRLKETIRQNHEIKIITVQLPLHQGTSIARNKGIAVSNGEFIFFLDCDDLYFLNHIERSVHFLTEHQEYQWTLSPGIFYRNFYGFIKTFCYTSPKHLNDIDFEYLSHHLIQHNFPIPMGTGICCKKSIFNDPENRFSSYLSKKTAEDIHFGLTLIKKQLRPFFFSSPSVIHRSFWKYKSRSINADQVSDILNVSNYITKDAANPIINQVHKKSINNDKALKHIKRQQEIFSVQSLLFRSQYKKSLHFILHKPYLYKHWIRLLLIQAAVKEPFSILHGVYWYCTTSSDKKRKRKTLAFLKDIKTQSIAY